MNTMKVIIRPNIGSLSGRPFELQVPKGDATYRISDLLVEVARTLSIGILPQHLRVTFGGHNLNEDRLLSDYNVQDGNTIDCVGREWVKDCECCKGKEGYPFERIE